MAKLVVLSYFETKDLSKLLAAVRRAQLPAGVRVYLGTYGANPAIARQVAAGGGLYAPMFAIGEDSFRQQRRLPPGDDSKVPKQFAGAIPPLDRLVTTSARVAWGVELGARYRDAIRATERAGGPVAAWQFDELVPAAASAGGVAVREFTRGILRGLLVGRGVLGDATMRGFVWVAHSALGVARLPITAELTTFWRTFNRAALAYVGEEYPRFEGNPRAVARAYASGQRALAAGGPERRALGRRYAPGMTPGYDPAVNLGGNVHGWARPQVNAWRATYVQERAHAGVAGFAEFDFRAGNSSATVMHDVLSAIAAEI